MSNSARLAVQLRRLRANISVPEAPGSGRTQPQRVPSSSTNLLGRAWLADAAVLRRIVCPRRHRASPRPGQGMAVQLGGPAAPGLLHARRSPALPGRAVRSRIPRCSRKQAVAVPGRNPVPVGHLRSQAVPRRRPRLRSAVLLGPRPRHLGGPVSGGYCPNSTRGSVAAGSSAPRTAARVGAMLSHADQPRPLDQTGSGCAKRNVPTVPEPLSFIRVGRVSR